MSACEYYENIRMSICVHTLVVVPNVLNVHYENESLLTY